MPNIQNHVELASVLRESQAFDNESDIAEAMNELRARTGTDQVGVGIKKALLAVEKARQEERNMVSRFAEEIAGTMEAQALRLQN